MLSLRSLRVLRSPTATAMSQGLLSALRARLRARRAAPINPQDAARRAARGAAYLDGVDPGWHARVDADALTLADGGACVLGQLHGAFRDGLWRARLFDGTSAPRAVLSPVAYGFFAADRAPDLAARDYALLDAAWRTEIARRRPAVQAPARMREPAAVPVG